MKIQNYEFQDDENDDFVQLKSFMPNRCFRMLICAPSGGGKTNLLLDMIYRLLYFDKIYLYARNLSQSKYKHLLKSLEPISKEYQKATKDPFSFLYVDKIRKSNAKNFDEKI